MRSIASSNWPSPRPSHRREPIAELHTSNIHWRTYPLTIEDHHVHGATRPACNDSGNSGCHQATLRFHRTTSSIPGCCVVPHMIHLHMQCNRLGVARRGYGRALVIISGISREPLNRTVSTRHSLTHLSYHNLVFPRTWHERLAHSTSSYHEQKRDNHWRISPCKLYLRLLFRVIPTELRGHLKSDSHRTP